MTNVKAYLQKLRYLELKNPVLVGFGIKDKASFNDACTLANGAIIGTAFINALGNNEPVEKSVKQFIDGILV